MAHDPADVHLLRNQDKTFRSERLHLVIVIDIDSFRIYVFLANLQFGCIYRLADLALVTVNLEKLFAPLLISGDCRIKTLLFLSVNLFREQTELEGVRIYWETLFRTAAIQLLLQIGDTVVL